MRRCPNAISGPGAGAVLTSRGLSASSGAKFPPRCLQIGVYYTLLEIDHKPFEFVGGARSRAAMAWYAIARWAKTNCRSFAPGDFRAVARNSRSRRCRSRHEHRCPALWDVCLRKAGDPAARHRAIGDGGSRFGLGTRGARESRAAYVAGLPLTLFCSTLNRRARAVRALLTADKIHADAVGVRVVIKSPGNFLQAGALAAASAARVHRGRAVVLRNADARTIASRQQGKAPLGCLRTCARGRSQPPVRATRLPML